MLEIREFANKTARLVDLGCKMQHFGMESLIPAIKETLKEDVSEPECGYCGTILTEEEEEHCGLLCFECAERIADEVIKDHLHPDDPTN